MIVVNGYVHSEIIIDEDLLEVIKTNQRVKHVLKDLHLNHTVSRIGEKMVPVSIAGRTFTEKVTSKELNALEEDHKIFIKWLKDAKDTESGTSTFAKE
jgi:hypothetical protein